LIGDVPQRKRLDRALDIFEKLYANNKKYKLFVKGKRPEEYPWMKSISRKPEMDYYQNQYQRIEDNGWQHNIIFEGHGPIDNWLQKIDYILSVSDFESFHLSPAEGMASGAIPVILNWPGSKFIYPDKCIFNTVEQACQAVINDDLITAENSKKYVNLKFSKKLNAEKIMDILMSK
jgi:glycosyltransferase involved in cell wall biosynthesis